jgi:hypothetical protein
MRKFGNRFDVEYFAKETPSGASYSFMAWNGITTWKNNRKLEGKQWHLNFEVGKATYYVPVSMTEVVQICT